MLSGILRVNNRIKVCGGHAGSSASSRRDHNRGYSAKDVYVYWFLIICNVICVWENYERYTVHYAGEPVLYFMIFFIEIGLRTRDTVVVRTLLDKRL